jgi:molecular chaperone IbpA
MAVAGFGEDDLSIVARDNTLVVSGKVRQPGQNVVFLYRGIAGRAFERRSTLADYVKVAGASLSNGMLVIEVVR